jgi:hypothetical protein
MQAKAIPSFAIVASITALLYFAGCATLFKGPSEKVEIESDPFGAKVYVNGNLIGKTPLELRLETRKTYYIEFAKDGYGKKTVVLNNSVGAGWIVLDVIFGLVPIVVDAATGNWYSLDDDNVRAVLEREPGTPLPEDTTRSIVAEPPREETRPYFTIELENKKPKNVLGGKVALTYDNRPWSSRSKVSFKGVFGVARDRKGPFNDSSLEISRGDVFYVQVTSDVFYRVQVEQETHNTITLRFSRM